MLNQESKPELPCNQIVQLVGQVGAQQRNIILAELVEILCIEAARVHPIDKIDGRDVGIGAERGTRYHEIPSLVADIDPECRALGAERAVA